MQNCSTQNLFRGVVLGLITVVLAACSGGLDAPSEAPNAEFITESKVDVAVTTTSDQFVELASDLELAAPPEEFAACFYEDIDYQGDALCVPKAQVGDGLDFPSVGPGNDKTSSILLAPGYKLEAYYDVNFGGGGWVISGDINFLGLLVDPSGVDFNDKISSAKLIVE